jgi:hypothetical protein
MDHDAPSLPNRCVVASQHLRIPDGVKNGHPIHPRLRLEESVQEFVLEYR